MGVIVSWINVASREREHSSLQPRRTFLDPRARYQDDRHAGWSDHSEEELWAIVAFLEKLPGMSEPDYAKLVMASIARGGHQDRGNAGDAAQCPTR
jgi:hypothetical protein